jgi:hypothetical protein
MLTELGQRNHEPYRAARYRVPLHGDGRLEACGLEAKVQAADPGV